MVRDPIDVDQKPRCVPIQLECRAAAIRADGTWRQLDIRWMRARFLTTRHGSRTEASGKIETSI